MEVLDINTFLSLKTNETFQELDSKTLELMTELFGSVDKNRKGKKNIKKTNVNILKNQKIQNKKDNISNKVNLILNKLSESNIDNLIIEFLENINQVDKETFEEIQKIIYIKVLSEINFIKIYLQFFKILTFIYKQVQKYDISFFFSIIESKIRLDYTNWDIDAESKFDFVRELDGETKRINNLILIKNLVENKFLSEKVVDYCDYIILEQYIFLPDIYHWFNSKNRNLTEPEKNKIINYLKKDGISQREKVLLESLVNKKIIKLNEQQHQNQHLHQQQHVQLVKEQTKSKPENVIKTDTLNLECENIIDEYILMKSLDDIKYFINNVCIDAISKNKFCENLIDRYFSSNKENSGEIINLIKELIKSQTLFKSNLSRGLLMIYNNWKEKSIDYNKPTDKMKSLLIMFKSIGITKGLEIIIDNYKITN
jgi:hypothetical protein